MLHMRKASIAGIVLPILFLGLIGASRCLADDDAQAVVVVANQNVPESAALARHYMQARGIPIDRLCIVDLPVGGTIARDIYERSLRDPLLDFLRKRKLIDQVRRNPGLVQPDETGWETLSSKIRYVVCMYGVPWRIADTRWPVIAAIENRLNGARDRDEAAVDSELALLLAPGYDIKSAHPNPLFSQIELSELSGPAQWVLIAARLDGPDVGTVKRMIDDAVESEKYGLQGRAYFDIRGIKDPGYAVGDYWIREAYERFLREGYECVLDNADGLWSESYPMEDSAVYMGWYTENVSGPFTRPDFRFARGAVAYHIHSSSAVDLRSADNFWVGPLLARGAAATMGAVSEPYLGYTPQLHLFAERLCRGNSFGESAYMSLPVLSWQITVLGDPLYRPFKYALNDQIEHLEKDGRAELDWAYLRKINLLVREGRFNVALNTCRERLQKGESLILREKLGDLYAKNELYQEAGEQYRTVIENAKTAETAVRVGARWMLILRLLGEKEKADQIETELRTRWKGHVVLPWLDTAKP
jgi:uncharacterized protein (TIGR03790 family)